MANPNWLDEQRRHSLVYATKIHHRCTCSWEKHHLPGDAGQVWVLRTRRVSCVIHGKDGSH